MAVVLIAYYIHCFVNVYRFIELVEGREWEKEIYDLSVLSKCLDNLSQINMGVLSQDIVNINNSNKEALRLFYTGVAFSIGIYVAIFLVVMIIACT